MTASRDYEVSVVDFPGLQLSIREYAFSPVNANQVWPAAQQFAAWISAHWDLFQGKKVLELGSGCGALGIWLAKKGLTVTTSDYTDTCIEENIQQNCMLNGLQPLPHIQHTWGTEFPAAAVSSFDTILGSDVLIYRREYVNLVKTLGQLLRQGAVCYLNNRRRDDTESDFLSLCRHSGLSIENLGSKVFEITKEA